MTRDWKIPAAHILESGPVVPVIVIDDPDSAVPLAEALLEGGIRVLEITLRTEAALKAIEEVARALPEAVVGAGTVLNGKDLKAVTEAGGMFAISPGLTSELLEAAWNGPIALIPGISTVSELMTGLQHGYECFKFFPAEAAGGLAMLKALSGPFPQVRFCPTGGISPGNYLEYLALKNVLCVGGSWLAPKRLIEEKDWAAVTALARKAVKAAASGAGHER